MVGCKLLRKNHMSMQGSKRKSHEHANITVAIFGNYHLPKCKYDD